MAKRALVIGGGPSVTKNLKHYHRLGDFDGIVLSTDNSVQRMIEGGWRNFYAVTLEDTPDLNKYYLPESVQKHGSEILGGLVADRVHRDTKQAMSDAGIRVKNTARCRGFVTSNVGLYCWLIAVEEFKCDEVLLIGMDHAYGIGQKPKVNKYSSDPDERELYLHAFQELINPYNDEDLILDPANQLWHEEFVWYAKRYPKVKTINCTGRGALFDKCFTWKPISEMQNWSDC